MGEHQRGLRIVYQANAPWAQTGYGRQSAYLLPAFADMPEVEEVVVLSFYGLQGNRIRHRIGQHTFTVLPTTVDDWGNDAISHYVEEFHSDVVITLLDLWPLAPNYGSGFRHCPYAPIDVTPVPPAFTERLRKAYLPILYSQHACRELEALGIEHTYAPHGVDTDQYKPMPRMQKAYRRSFDWPEEAVNGYVFGMVAANKGYPARKAFPEVFEAFARFLAEGHDAWLYIHTLLTAEHGGPNLIEMAQSFGVGHRMLAPHRHLLLSGQYDDTDMMRLYNCFDCLLAPSYSEGFGIPILESQACGTPVITTDAFAMTELCGAGWLVPWDHKLYLPIGGSYVMPSVEGIGRAMRSAHEAGRGPFVDAARTFALPYDWKRVVETHWRPIIQRLHRELTPRVHAPSPPMAVDGRTSPPTLANV